MIRTLPESTDLSNETKTTKRIKPVVPFTDIGIIYRDTDLTVLDSQLLVTNTWQPYNQGVNVIDNGKCIGWDWYVPPYWFNLHHPYIPYTLPSDTFQINQTEEKEISDASSLITSSELFELEFSALEFSRKTINKFNVSNIKKLFQQTLCKYFNTEPHRPTSLLWEDVINFPGYINMLTTLCNNKSVAGDDLVLDNSTQPLELTLDQVYFRHIVNPNSTIGRLIISPYNEEYWLPPQSSFIISDLKQASQLLLNSAPEIGYDIIVMDPPYFNTSAERSKIYGTEDLYQLFNLPVKSIINQQGGILAVWITNRPKIRKFIINKLFKDWGFELAAEWVWLKVTSDGIPVINIESSHRKPYESILIGIKSSTNITHNIPKHHAIISVPCKIHSKKPPIFDLISNYIVSTSSQKSHLELFGRSMHPFTTTWGNEPIKFQRSNSYRQN